MDFLITNVAKTSFFLKTLSFDNVIIIFQFNQKRNKSDTKIRLQNKQWTFEAINQFYWCDFFLYQKRALTFLNKYHVLQDKLVGRDLPEAIHNIYLQFSCQKRIMLDRSTTHAWHSIYLFRDVITRKVAHNSIQLIKNKCKCENDLKFSHLGDCTKSFLSFRNNHFAFLQHVYKSYVWQWMNSRRTTLSLKFQVSIEQLRKFYCPSSKTNFQGKSKISSKILHSWLFSFISWTELLKRTLHNIDIETHIYRSVTL